LEPGGPLNPQGSLLLQFEIPKVQPAPGSDPDQGVLGADRQPSYATLLPARRRTWSPSRSWRKSPCRRKKKLILWGDLDRSRMAPTNFPPALSDTGLNERLITWIRARATNGAQVKILWTGINCDVCAATGARLQRNAAGWHGRTRSVGGPFPDTDGCLIQSR